MRGLVLITVSLVLLLGCLGDSKQQTPKEETQVEEPSREAFIQERLPSIALKESDFPSGGWVQGATNASGDSYEARFFKVAFGFGEMSTVVSTVHYYNRPEDAMRDFAEARDELAGEAGIKEAGVGEDSISWSKLNVAYILFVKKNIAVELQLINQENYDYEYLKGLAVKIDERI